MHRIEDMIRGARPIKWLFTGDSITHGALHTYGHRDYVQLFEERIRYEMGRSRDVVIRTAISGWTTQDILDDIDWNILCHQADVLSIMIGMNDAALGPPYIETVVANLKTILDKTTAGSNPALILHTPNPVQPGGAIEREEALPAIVEQIKSIADEHGALLVDHWSDYTSAWNENAVRIGSWMDDPIHPGKFGHRTFARLLFKHLGIWDETAVSGRYLIP